MTQENNQLVLISGVSGSGKSASLRNIPNMERWAFFNTEAGKRIPFRGKFMEQRVTDPYEVHEGFEELIENPDASDGAIVDTITFLMDMFESQYVLGTSNTMQGWSDYAQYFKKLLQDYIVKYNKPVFILGHVLERYDSESLEFKSEVPIKGSLKNQGVEAYFSTVVQTEKVSLKDLEPYQSDLLNITAEEEALGFKYVFQTKLTKKTLGKRIRSPMGMFSDKETYMDNDAMLLLKRLNDYYN